MEGLFNHIPQPDTRILPQWTAQSRLIGCGVLYFKAKLSRDHMSTCLSPATSPFHAPYVFGNSEGLCNANTHITQDVFASHPPDRAKRQCSNSLDADGWMRRWWWTMGAAPRAAMRRETSAHVSTISVGNPLNCDWWSLIPTVFE